MRSTPKLLRAFIYMALIAIGMTALTVTAFAYRVPGWIDIGSIDTLFGGEKIACPEGGKAVKYEYGGIAGLNVTAPAAGLYRVYVRTASSTGGRFMMGTDELSPMMVPRTGSFAKYVTLTDYITLEAGSQIVQLTEFEGSLAISWIEFDYCLPGRIEAEGYSENKGIKVNRTGESGKSVALGKGSILRYTVDVAEAGTYRAEFSVSGEGGRFEFKEDGTSRGFVNLPPSKDKWAAVQTDITLTAGRHILNIVSSSGNWALDWLRIYKPPEPLRIDGNRILNGKGEPVRLLGVNVASLEWTVKGDRVLRSCAYACDNWHSNLIRLPVSAEFWLNDDGGYRNLIRRVVELVAARGKYVNLDMHGFLMPNGDTFKAWNEIAREYGGNPAVLFGLYNEPHDISWKVWRDGGTVNSKETGSYQTPGMQALTTGIRDAGATNILIIGGLDWSYDLRGINGKYAIDDPLKQVMYDTHPYPWKPKDRDNYVTLIADRYPILVGEMGCDPVNDAAGVSQYPGGGPGYMTDILRWMDEHQYNLTAWCFHTGAGPILLSDWLYTPTPFNGAYVRNWLYEHNSTNLTAGKPVSAGPNWLMADLGETRAVRRWVVKCPEDSSLRKAAYLTLQTSFDGTHWSDVDYIDTAGFGGDWDGAYIDRVIKPFRGRYVRLVSKGNPDLKQDYKIELWD